MNFLCTVDYCGEIDIQSSLVVHFTAYKNNVPENVPNHTKPWKKIHTRKFEIFYCLDDAMCVLDWFFTAWYNSKE